MTRNLPAKSRVTQVVEQTIRAGALALVLALCQSAAAVQSLAVAWGPSSAPGVAGYAVYYGTNSASLASRVDAGTNTSYTVSGLPEGQTVYFVVTAYSNQGVESAPSNLIQYVVPGVLQVSPKPTPRSPALINFPVAPNHTYSLQASVNLQNWSTIWQSTTTTNGWMQVRDVEGANLKMRFYRLVWQ